MFLIISVSSKTSFKNTPPVLFDFFSFKKDLIFLSLEIVSLFTEIFLSFDKNCLIFLIRLKIRRSIRRCRTEGKNFSVSGEYVDPRWFVQSHQTTQKMIPWMTHSHVHTVCESISLGKGIENMNCSTCCYRKKLIFLHNHVAGPLWDAPENYFEEPVKKFQARGQLAPYFL